MNKILINVQESLEAVNYQNAQGAVKIWQDLERYDRIIKETKPDIIVECGTWQGESARWFVSHNLDVITIDLFEHIKQENRDHPRITFIHGSSIDSDIVKTVKRLTKNKRVMVVLDSDHSAEHVTNEIKTYAKLVTPGCYMVVEDGIVRWMNDPYIIGSPLDAIENFMKRTRSWTRDIEIEQLHSVSMHPFGWLRRNNAS